MRITRIAVPAAFALALIGCGHENAPPQAANNAATETATRNATPPREADNALTMSDDLRQACAIENTGTAPKFDFDSAVLSARDRSELDQLATCMTSGPLKDKSVKLVGRADPRGEAEYNMNLGAIRASAVKHYLAQLGVSSARLSATSRGALDARGYDETSWAIDRRVDLRLAGP
jgi:peptidoglycan-associated lipoprotein